MKLNSFMTCLENNNNAFCVNSPIFTNSMPGGSLNLSMSADQYVTTGTNELPFGSSPRSFFSWIYVTNYPKSGQIYPIGCYGTNVPYESSCLYLTSGRNLDFSPTGADFGSNQKVPLDEWTFVGYTISASTVVIYTGRQNTTLVLGRALNTKIGSSFIGKDLTGDFMNGEIGQVRYYNQTLSHSEVLGIYLSGGNLSLV